MGMKAFVVQQEFGVDNLALIDRPDSKPGPGQVLIKLHAFSLNYRDLLVVTGRYDPQMPRPRIPLSDGAGEVAAIGEGVSRVRVGDRVAGIFMQTWLEGPYTSGKAEAALGGAIDGLLAEYAVLHEDGVVPVPAHLSYAEAATLPCAAVTAWNALMTEEPVKAGDSVLVQGTGGVAMFALQFARAGGARVIAISSSDDKLQRLRALGVLDSVNYRSTPDWDRRVRELTDGVGVDHVVEVGGAGTLNRSLGAVRAAGRISMIGVLTGRSAEINTAAILRNAVHIRGIYVGSRAMFEAMNRAISLHTLHPIIDRVFPFQEIRQALHYMESGAHLGKIVVCM
jgi:NADPH:quinone reductase-like Zn-dependent oxidoreductase